MSEPNHHNRAENKVGKNLLHLCEVHIDNNLIVWTSEYMKMAL